MMVDLFKSRLRPFGTGMSSNSLRWGRGGEDAHAVRVTTMAERTSKCRMAGTSSAPSYNQRGRRTKFLVWLLLVALPQGCAPSPVLPVGDQGRPFPAEADERALWGQAEKEEDKLAKTGDVHDDPSLVQYLERIAARVLPREVKGAEGPAIRVIVFRDPTLNAFAMPNVRVYLHTGLLARVEREADTRGVERMLEAGYDPREAPRVFERLKLDPDDASGPEPFFFGNRAQL